MRRIFVPCICLLRSLLSPIARRHNAGRSPFDRLGPALAALALLAAIAALPRLGFAQSWDSPICYEQNVQNRVSVASDGSGGMYVTWNDQRLVDGNTQLFVQHVLASGVVDPAWPQNGVVVDATLGMGQGDGFGFFPTALSDGAGGATLVYIIEIRVGDEGRADIKACHVTPQGVIERRAGIFSGNYPYGQGVMMGMSCLSDGAGGAKIVWGSAVGGNGIDVFYRRYYGDGTMDPALVVCGASNRQVRPVLTEDGVGGVIVAWSDDRAGNGADDVYAQRVGDDGSIYWTTNGVPLNTVAGGTEYWHHIAIAPDGSHGAICVWQDRRDAPSKALYAQRVKDDGTVAWATNGIRISSGTPIATAYSDNIAAEAAYDGSGGAYVAWTDDRGPDWELYGQHLLADGTQLWAADGLQLTNVPNFQYWPRIAAGPYGDAYLTFTDQRNATDENIYVEHFISSGLDPSWPANGAEVTVSPGNQHYEEFAVNGTRGLFAWVDFRNESFDSHMSDIYGAIIPQMVLDVPRNAGVDGLSLAAARPNPARTAASFAVTLPSETNVSLAIYDATGRRVREIFSGSRPAGEFTWHWNLRNTSGTQVTSGVYFARLVAGEHTLHTRFAVLQ